MRQQTSNVLCGTDCVIKTDLSSQLKDGLAVRPVYDIAASLPYH